jgi:hypothetical protein
VGLPNGADLHARQRHRALSLLQAPRLDLVEGDERDLIDRLGFGFGNFGAAPGERSISERQIAGDGSSIAILLGKSGSSRFGGAAAEIFAVVGHARFPLFFSFSGETRDSLPIAPPS